MGVLGSATTMWHGTDAGQMRNMIQGETYGWNASRMMASGADGRVSTGNAWATGTDSVINGGARYLGTVQAVEPNEMWKTSSQVATWYGTDAGLMQNTVQGETYGSNTSSMMASGVDARVSTANAWATGVHTLGIRADRYVGTGQLMEPYQMGVLGSATTMWHGTDAGQMRNMIQGETYGWNASRIMASGADGRVSTGNAWATGTDSVINGGARYLGTVQAVEPNEMWKTSSQVATWYGTDAGLMQNTVQGETYGSNTSSMMASGVDGRVSTVNAWSTGADTVINGGGRYVDSVRAVEPYEMWNTRSEAAMWHGVNAGLVQARGEADLYTAQIGQSLYFVDEQVAVDESGVDLIKEFLRRFAEAKEIGGDIIIQIVNISNGSIGNITQIGKLTT